MTDDDFQLFETNEKFDEDFQNVSHKLMGAELIFEINYEENKKKFK